MSARCTYPGCGRFVNTGHQLCQRCAVNLMTDRNRDVDSILEPDSCQYNLPVQRQPGRHRAVRRMRLLNMLRQRHSRL